RRPARSGLPPCNRFAVNPWLTLLPHRRPKIVLMGQVAMTVLRLCKAAEETGAGEPTMWRAIEPGGMSTELTEDGGAPNVSLRQLPAPGTIAASDLAARLAAAHAASPNT